MKEHSEFKYLLDLIDMIDWSVVPDFSNKMGRTGYSRRALLKAIFVQKVKGFTVRELIHFLKSNPSFAKCIGFDPIINYVPSEATFSSFKKEFDPSYLDKVIVFTVLKGIKEGINVPIFTVVSPASAHGKNYALVLLEKVVKYLDLSGFNFLADAAYVSRDVYDYETTS
jgi:hypothetical protein